MDAARDLFISNGYERTTFEDIAKRINLSKGAVFWHFKSKSDLLLTMIREAAERMDFGEIEAIFHELRDYVLTSEDEKAVKEMEGMLLQLDFEGISALTESLILS